MNRKAHINIPGRFSGVFPIVDENNKGFICRTGQKDSPATEWFPFNSPNGTTATEVTTNEN